MKEEETKESLQNAFLNQLRKEKKLSTVVLMNGVKMCGIIKGFDNHTIVLSAHKSWYTSNLIYKHAISTIQDGVSPETPNGSSGKR